MRNPTTYLSICRTTQRRAVLTCGLLIALLHSAFIYVHHWGWHTPLLTTVTGVASLYLLLIVPWRTWFAGGFFIGIAWFWWIGVSFWHYRMPYAIPLAVIGIGLLYGLIFGLFAYGTEKLVRSVSVHFQDKLRIALKAVGLWSASYLHPFGFDWYKPELIFVDSYLGIDKAAFGLVLLALAITASIGRAYPLVLALLAINPSVPSIITRPTAPIALLDDRTPMEIKWDQTRFATRFDTLLQRIEKIEDRNITAVVLPESVFPLFLNRAPRLFERLQSLARHHTLIVGSLAYDKHGTPLNVAYIFYPDGNVTVAPKTVLVPFGEVNPLPDVFSRWINRIFYDGAVDYRGAKHPTDVHIDGHTYRIAICYEATSEKLYDPPPKRMIVLSNNGWFYPSIEPTLQRLLLLYYARKYGTAFYHAINMSPSYAILPHKG